MAIFLTKVINECCRVPRILSLTAVSVAQFHLTPGRNLFYEGHRKGEKKYVSKRRTLKDVWNDIPIGKQRLKEEFKVLYRECKEKLAMDPEIPMPGCVKILWKFDNKDVLVPFTVTSDKNNNDGFSECEFVFSKNKTALFRGILSTQLPKDGKLHRSGYCNFRSWRPLKSFHRPSFYEWCPYTHIILRIRGDGRSYMINLATEGEFDLTWNDIYNYVLYTRGGPYWQDVQIPFSKFFLASKGRIQDQQFPIPLTHVTSFGITCADQAPGPFNLEIDYIGLYFDNSHTEEFAYELYEAPKYTVAV